MNRKSLIPTIDSFSPEEIQKQVAKISNTAAFKRSERLRAFLRYVIEEYLNNRGDRIKGYSIAVAVFNRSDRFDPQTDNIVRVYGGKLRRALDDYYELYGKEDPVVIQVPKGGYQPVILHKDAVSVDQPEKTENNNSQTSLGVESTPAIAVFSFENTSNETDSDYLASGLTNEIIVALTRFSPLEVLGPMIESEYHASDYSKLYEKYKSRFVLQGKIKQIDRNSKISVTLSDAKFNRKIWGRSFFYDLDKVSLFEIEEELSGQIAGEIGDGLGIIFRKLQTETYWYHIKLNNVTEAVLKYNMAWMIQTPSAWVAAHKAVREAVIAYPTNALLIALLSNIYYADVLYELQLATDSRERMEALAFKAVSMDPDLQIAQYNLVVQHALHGRVEECVEQARKVVAMNPNHARILAGSAIATSCVGAYDQSFEYIERAKKLNPHFPGFYHFVNYIIHFGRDEYDQAWAEVQKIHMNELLWHPLLRAAVLGKLGELEKAQVYLRDLIRIKSDFISRYDMYIRGLLVTDRHVEMIWDGLNKAGIKQVASGR